MNECMNKCCMHKPDVYRTETALPEQTAPTMAYVPFQLDLSHFGVDEALAKGTYFIALSKPFKGKCTC